MSPKLALIQAGAALAAAAVGNLPDTLQLDPEIANDETKAMNWMGYRLTQIYAIGLANAIDPANPKRWEWPAWLEQADANTAIGGPLGKLAELALPALSASQPALAALLQTLLAGKTATPATTGKIPDLPGAVK